MSKDRTTVSVLHRSRVLGTLPNTSPAPVIGGGGGVAKSLDPLPFSSGEASTAKSCHFQMPEIDTYAECIQEAASMGGVQN